MPADTKRTQHADKKSLQHEQQEPVRVSSQRQRVEEHDECDGGAPERAKFADRQHDGRTTQKDVCARKELEVDHYERNAYERQNAQLQ